MARLEAEGEFAEQLFVHGLGVQTAEGLAEWLHYEVREMLGIAATQGRRYSWGYPAVPEQSEHLKVEELLRPEQIGMSITDGYAPDPEQSTLALVAHHPQAIYFGTRQGRLLPDGSPGRPDPRLQPRPVAVRRARRRGPARRGGRSRGRARDGGRGRLARARPAAREQRRRDPVEPAGRRATASSGTSYSRGRVGRGERQPLEARLGDEHAVERIAVVRRQAPGLERRARSVIGSRSKPVSSISDRRSHRAAAACPAPA